MNNSGCFVVGKTANACRMLLAVIASVILGPGSLLAVEPGEGSYRLAAGDRVSIAVFGEQDLSMEVLLNDSGSLTYPFLGELEVEGVTLRELEQTITSGLKGPYLINPVVTVSIVEYRPFFVHGEVMDPGGIPYQPRLTVERAVALAGGFTERGSRNKIEVIREGDTSQTSQSVVLADPVYAGDVLMVGQSFF